MKSIFTYLFIFSASLFRLSGQTDPKGLAEADDLFLKNRFALALPYYLNLIGKDSLNTDLNYKIGIGYLYSRSQKVLALRYLEKTIRANPPVTAYKFLGDAYLLANQFNLAWISYEQYKKLLIASRFKDVVSLEEVNWKMEMCRVGNKLFEAAADTANLNAHYIDFTPALSYDQTMMNFTFRKPEGIKRKPGIRQHGQVLSLIEDDRNYYNDIMRPVQWGSADTSGHITDTTTYNTEATVATSVDGQIVLTYMDDKGEGNLYLTRLIGNEWISSEKLSKPVNRTGWEHDEFISPDGGLLYFTSKRPEGYGGKDIYVSKKLPNGEWGAATNLGPVINTAFDEEAPFIYPDGRTLFFSSNKYKKSGCYDNFSSMLAVNGEWTEPVKIGYPARKNSETIFYAAATDSKKAAAPVRGDSARAIDTYLATFADQKKALFTVLKGRVVDSKGQVPAHVKITVTDNETGEILNVYSSNYRTGSFLITLPQGRNNNITYESEGCLFQSENVDNSKKYGQYELRNAVQMPPLAPGSTVVLNNVFFDFDKAALQPVSYVELNKLFDLLYINPRMTAALSYHFSNQPNSKYNMKLSRDRAEMVVDYLVKMGINKEQVLVKEPEKSKNTKQKRKRDKNGKPDEILPAEYLELTILSTK